MYTHVATTSIVHNLLSTASELIMCSTSSSIKHPNSGSKASSCYTCDNVKIVLFVICWLGLVRGWESLQPPNPNYVIFGEKKEGYYYYMYLRFVYRLK